MANKAAQSSFWHNCGENTHQPVRQLTTAAAAAAADDDDHDDDDDAAVQQEVVMQKQHMYTVQQSC